MTARRAAAPPANTENDRLIANSARPLPESGQPAVQKAHTRSARRGGSPTGLAAAKGQTAEPVGHIDNHQPASPAILPSLCLRGSPRTTDQHKAAPPPGPLDNSTTPLGAATPAAKLPPSMAQSRVSVPQLARTASGSDALQASPSYAEERRRRSEAGCAGAGASPAAHPKRGSETKAGLAQLEQQLAGLQSHWDHLHLQRGSPSKAGLAQGHASPSQRVAGPSGLRPEVAASQSPAVEPRQQEHAEPASTPCAPPSNAAWVDAVKAAAASASVATPSSPARPHCSATTPHKHPHAAKHAVNSPGNSHSQVRAVRHLSWTSERSPRPAQPVEATPGPRPSHSAAEDAAWGLLQQLSKQQASPTNGADAVTRTPQKERGQAEASAFPSPGSNSSFLPAKASPGRLSPGDHAGGAQRRRLPLRSKSFLAPMTQPQHDRAGHQSDGEQPATARVRLPALAPALAPALPPQRGMRSTPQPHQNDALQHASVYEAELSRSGNPASQRAQRPQQLQPQLEPQQAQRPQQGPVLPGCLDLRKVVLQQQEEASAAPPPPPSGSVSARHLSALAEVRAARHAAWLAQQGNAPGRPALTQPDGSSDLVDASHIRPSGPNGASEPPTQPPHPSHSHAQRDRLPALSAARAPQQSPAQQRGDNGAHSAHNRRRWFPTPGAQSAPGASSCQPLPHIQPQPSSASHGGTPRANNSQQPPVHLASGNLGMTNEGQVHGPQLQRLPLQPVQPCATAPLADRTKADTVSSGKAATAEQPGHGSIARLQNSRRDAAEGSELADQNDNGLKDAEGLWLSMLRSPAGEAVFDKRKRSPKQRKPQWHDPAPPTEAFAAAAAEADTPAAVGPATQPIEAGAQVAGSQNEMLAHGNRARFEPAAPLQRQGSTQGPIQLPPAILPRSAQRSMQQAGQQVPVPTGHTRHQQQPVDDAAVAVLATQVASQLATALPPSPGLPQHSNPQHRPNGAPMMFPLFQETPGALGGVQLSGAGDFSRGSAADQNGQHRMNQQLGRWQQPPEGNSELPRPRGKAPQRFVRHFRPWATEDGEAAASGMHAGHAGPVHAAWVDGGQAPNALEAGWPHQDGLPTTHRLQPLQHASAAPHGWGSAAEQGGRHHLNHQMGQWRHPPEQSHASHAVPAAQLAQEEAELAVRLLQVRQRLRALEAEPSGVASTSAELQSAQQAVGRALRRVATAHAQPPRQRPPDGAADGFDPRSNSEWHEMHGAPPGRQAAGRRPVGDGGFGGLGLGDVLATATPSPPKVARPSTQAAHGEGSSAAGDQREAGAAHSRLRASAGFRGASLADVLVQPPRRPVLGRVRPRGGYDGGSSSREGSEAGSRRESRDGGAHSRHAPTGQQDDAFGGLSLTDVFRPAPHSTAAQETDVPRRRPMRAHPSLHGQQSFLEDLLQSGTSGQRPFIRRASEPSAAREPASVLTTAGRQHGSGGQLAVAVDADGFPVLEALQDLSAPGRRKSAGQGRAAIALLEKFTYSEATFAARRRRPSAQGSEHPECSICLDAFNHQQQLRGFSGCGHCFHERCISEWFSTGDTRCPNCRWDPMTNSR